jgi:hypothetical protein
VQEAGHSHHVDEQGKSLLVVKCSDSHISAAGYRDCDLVVLGHSHAASPCYIDEVQFLRKAIRLCANLCEGQWPFSSEPDFSACPSQSFSTGSTFAYRPQVVFLSFA